MKRIVLILNFENRFSFRESVFLWREIQNTILTPMLEFLCPKSKKISLKLQKNRRRFYQNRYFAQKCPLDIY